MTLTHEEKEFLLDLYTSDNLSQKEIIESFRQRFGCYVSKQTIYNLLKKKGKLKSHGGYRYGLSEDKLRKLHQQYKGDLGKIVKATNYKSKNTLRERCRELGLVV